MTRIQKGISTLLFPTLLTAIDATSTHAQQAGDLSPARWPQQTVNELMLRENGVAPQGPAVTSDKGLVVVTSNPFAAHAGEVALRNGGTAADAVLTAAITQIALNAGSAYSYAGFMTFVYYDAASGKVTSMNAGFNTVQGETDPMTIPVVGTPSGRTALVPGFFAGVDAVHRRYGKLPFAELFDPAIYVAEHGFPMTGSLAHLMVGRKEVLTRLPATRAIFIKPNGELYQEGDLFRQPALAVTLRRVALQGTRYIYRGDWAKHFVDAVRADGGKMSLKDMGDYQALWPEPLRGSYGDYELYTIGRPTYGGASLLQALNLYEASDLKRLGDYTKSPEALYRMIDIDRAEDALRYLAASDTLRREYVGDLDLSPESLLSKETAGRLWQAMQTPKWPELRQKVYDARVAASAVGDALANDIRNHPKHSAAVVAVDAQGNVAALLHTINTAWWGTTGIFVDGISIPDPAAYQQYAIAAVNKFDKPGGRLPDPTNPLVVLKDGKPFMGGSSIGSGLPEATFQSLVNMLEYGMDPQTAINAPQFLRSEWLAKDSERQTVVKGAFPAEILDGVRARGREIREVTSPETSMLRGFFIAIRIDPTTGKRSAGFLGSTNGAAEGY